MQTARILPLPLANRRDRVPSVWEVAEAFGGSRSKIFETAVPRLAEDDDEAPLTIEEGIRLAASVCESVQRFEAALVAWRWRLGFVLWHCGTVYGEATVRTFSSRLADLGYRGVGQTTLYNALRMVRRLDGDERAFREKTDSGELASWSRVLDWLSDDASIGEDPARYVDGMIRRAESGAEALSKANDAVARIPDPEERESRRAQIAGVATRLADETRRARDETAPKLDGADPLRSVDYLDFVRSLPCLLSGSDAPSRVVLVDPGSDWTAIPLDESLADQVEARIRRCTFKPDPFRLVAEVLHRYASGVARDLRGNA